MTQRANIEVGRINRSAPSARTEEGRPVYRVRCRVPFVFDCPGGPSMRKPMEPTPEQRAVEPSTVEGKRGLIEGIASSTSVDWYGTRMALSALTAMEAQFRAGVDYFPRHHSWTSAVEWSEVIGRTIDARIERSVVKDPKVEGELQHVLYVTTQLDVAEELSAKLIRRIEAGKGPGQSIGGWFTELQVTYEDEDDWEPSDIVILDVELDHLAAVRSPANPDSDKTFLALSEGLRGHVQRGESTADLAVQEHDDVISITYRKVEDAAPVALPAEVTPDTAPEGRSIPGAVPVVASDPSPEATPPRTGADTQARENQEIPMTPEQIAALVAAEVTRALQAQAAERSAAPATAPVVATPAPAAVITQADLDLANARAALAISEARARAAEVQLQALAAPAPAAPAARAGVQPTAAPAAPSAADAVIAGPGGINLREVAPRATKIALRAGEPVTAALVHQHDGMRAIVTIARAEGFTATADLAASDDLLTSNRSGAVRSLVARYGNRDAPKEGDSRMDRAGLEDLLVDVIRAGVDDGLIAKPSMYTSWA